MMLACDDHGDGSTVLLLHGFPLDRTMWSGQVGSIAASHRLIVPDFRGFGESGGNLDDLTIESMAQDVANLLDDKGIDEPVVIGGLSMGGYVALAFVRRFPERVRGLLLLNTRAAADSPEAAAGREENANKIEASGDTGPLVSGMIGRLFGPAIQGRPDVIASIAMMLRRVPPETVVAALRAMAKRPDRRSELPEIAAPTLVIAGSDDAIVPLDEARAMAEAIPRGRIEVYHGAGHLTPIEAADEVNAAIRRFLDELT